MNAPLNAQGLPEGTNLRPDEISPRDFAQRLKADPAKVKLIDVRTLSEWDTSRVEGAIHIPMEQLEQQADDLDLEDASVVGILCHHGVRSLRSALALQQMGHKNAVSIFGGIELWSQAVDASIPRYTRDRLTGRCTRL